MNVISLISMLVIPAITALVVGFGLFRGVDVYDAFIEGAKRALPTVARVLPYIVAITMAIGVFRVSGALDIVLSLIAPPFISLGVPPEILPMELLRPFSGSAAIGLLSDVFKEYGPDSLIGYTASVLMGSSETLFYTVALYFGSIGITKTRHTISASLIAGLISLIIVVWLCRLFF